MHIGIITHNIIPGDGQGRANYEIVKYALKQGARVRVVADAIAEDLLPDIEVYRVPLPSWTHKINLPKVAIFAQRADRIIQSWSEKPDILHNYGYCTSLPHDINTSQYVHAAWAQSAFHTSRTNRNLYGAYQWLYTQSNARWERHAYHQARVVVAASGTVREELKTLVGIPEDRLRVINNGADLTEFYPLPEGTEPDRTGLKLPEGVVLGVFAGDIRTPRKNLDSVLKAMAQVEGFHLAVVGRLEGSPYPGLTEQLGLTKRVHFLDFRRDIAAIFRASDFFVFPSRYEACALVLSEAAASGIPILSSRTTGGAEVIAPGAGLLIDDPNDIGALRDGLKALIETPGRREQMRSIARAHASEQSWEKIGKQYYDLYEELAQKR
ncbi:glycosyltransferase family 4 protein [Armatimonas sp.]|uniref:glycosyltransferase family 4 protein n=1 Tax=Armatimonas sp. TaxID=1872638 RepID=UPI00286AABE1|nr:glycosyltransferase family 4 protein [Armatimonas sp.]